MRDIDPHLIDVSVLSANPKFACTGEGIMAKRKKSKNRMRITEFTRDAVNMSVGNTGNAGEVFVSQVF